MDSDLASFGGGLAALDLTEIEIAVALLWFIENRGEATETEASKLGSLIHDLALRGQVNIYRLASRLSEHPDVVAGRQKNTFKIKLSSKIALDSRYASLLKRPSPKVQNHILDDEDFKGTRGYLESLAFQVNGAYQFGFYDACAVLCRRIIEILLIESFEKNGKATAIKKNNDYLALGDIIAIARGGNQIKLGRGTADILDEIKALGDTAAHNRTYITKEPDIDDLKRPLRRVVSELLHLASFK